MPHFKCTKYTQYCSGNRKTPWHLRDSIPTSFSWELSSTALASSANTHWNPCSCAYFGYLSMFVIFSLETVSHTHVASVWSVILSPASLWCPLCLEQRLRTWFSSQKWNKMRMGRWSFRSVFLCVCSLCAGVTHHFLLRKQWSRFEH